MAYKPKEEGNIRDKIYPSQIAAMRPALVSRIHCEESERPEETLRGGERPMHTRERVEQFNRQLRGGHSQLERDEE
jgi:hypothetical protein